jgi:hypothetical protein
MSDALCFGKIGGFAYLVRAESADNP